MILYEPIKYFIMKELKMIFSLLILILFFTSCDSDINPDPDPCDSAGIMALETSDPYSWLSDFNSRVSDESVTIWSPPNLVSPEVSA